MGNVASFRIDDAWLSAVSGWCDPVFEAADAGFVGEPAQTDGTDVGGGRGAFVR